MILSAFSLNMLETFPAEIRVEPVTTSAARKLARDRMSAVGHPDTAGLFSKQLGLDVPVNRAMVILKKGDTALVGQYRGPRLPAGTTTLPEGARLQWLLVRVG